jgi:hypothetical protein
MRWEFKTSQKHLDKLLEEAMVDCYDEYEAFMGVVVTLDERLPFPFEAKALGETVEVIAIDDNRCDPRRGVIATVRKGNKEYGVALSEIELPKKIKHNKWIEMYQYWLRGY